jgi:hypothetical protein
MDWDDFLSAVAALPFRQVWRHNTAGDLPGDGDSIDRLALSALVAANQGRQGFTYTHKPLDDPENAAAIAQANDSGFTINLSANNLTHADELADLGIGPVVVVLPATQTTNTRTPAGRKVVVCPHATHGVSCASCRLCARADRPCVIGFPAHGNKRQLASEIASTP